MDKYVGNVDYCIDFTLCDVNYVNMPKQTDGFVRSYAPVQEGQCTFDGIPGIFPVLAAVSVIEFFAKP